MPRKQVKFSSKTKAQSADLDLEDWVQTRGDEKQSVDVSPQNSVKSQNDRMKRLTLDISEQLHRTVKAKAVAEGKTMANMLRELLEDTYL